MRRIAKDHKERFVFEKDERSFNGKVIQQIVVEYSSGLGMSFNYIMLKIDFFDRNEDTVIVMLSDSHINPDVHIPGWMTLLISKHTPKWFLEDA